MAVTVMKQAGSDVVCSGHIQCYIVPVTFIEQRTFQIHGVNIRLNFDFVSILPGMDE